MKRSPLRRKTRLRQRRATPRRSGRVRDVAYMLWVKTRRCELWRHNDCDGPTEADHAGRRPLGRKADDRTAIPLCTKHHRERHAHCGVFSRWSAHDLRTWLDETVAATQARWAARNAEGTAS